MASWTLADFSDSLEAISRRTPPSEDNLKDVVAELGREWMDDTVDLSDIVQWSLSRFGMTNDGNFLFNDFETAYKQRVYQFKQLLYFIEKAGLLDCPEIVDTTANVERVMTAAYTTCFSTLVQFNRMEETRVIKIPPNVVDDESSLRHDDSTLTSFQKLLLYFLQRIEVKRYRKCGDSCFKRVITKSGYPTISYEYANTIKEEVWLLKKEVKWSVWKNFTNPRDNPKAVIDHLVESTQSEFPLYDVEEGDWFSFENGVYNIRHDIFFAYGDEENWSRRARDMERARCVPPNTYHHPTDEVVAVNHIERDFRPRIDPSRPNFDFDDTPTPSFERVFETQRLEKDTRFWVYAMIGRLFFRINRLERWQRALIIIGAGGTGKSTIAMWIMSVIPPHFFSLMSSNFEEQFGFSSLTSEEKRLCLCLEMTADLKIRQDEWQIFVEGGKMQVADKYAASRQHVVKQHLLMLGNQFPRKWNNNSLQISRRVFLIMFEFMVKKSSVDTNLIDEMRSETDLLLRKCTQCYIDVVNRYAQHDLEAPGILPPQIHAFQKTLVTNIDALSSFLDSGCFEFSQNNYMPMEHFKNDYFAYRKANGHNSLPWTKDAYTSIFQSFGLFVQYNEMDYDGKKMKCDFIIGLRNREVDA